ncbi:thermostable beta-glucosidase b [Fusarium circinatum]|uniref:beta-glucosidase n=1 Tax=Fusarium circinatum TaxID=48490 RepID=A0A8H5UF18_FUSCI|nr:thermostable beta-glucosidase b [Fusarium circinatum]
MDFQSFLPELTLEEKVSLLSGRDFHAAAGIDRLGIPPIKVANSVNGIGPHDMELEVTTASFPSTTCYGSTFDAELLGRLGEELAVQAKLKSAQLVLGPTIDIHRDPRGGRNFECFSEDPLVTGQLAGAIVNGLHQGGLGVCVKHFICNDAETYRHSYDVRESIDGVMTAYNKVDGHFCSANQDLIERVLRRDWAFKGMTMSDWFGVHDTVGPIKAGLDLEMPFPVFRASKLVDSVHSGAVTEEEIDNRVKMMLELRNRTRSCHDQKPERSEIRDEANKLAWEIATSGIVLLKNADKTLPISPLDSPKIALIGEFAADPVITGGGSASCIPQYRHSPLDIMRQEFPSVKCATGVRTRRLIPIAPTDQLMSTDGRPGVDIKYYDEESSELLLSEFQAKPHVWMLGRFKPGLRVPGFNLQLTTKLTPVSTGQHTLAVRCTGSFSLAINDNIVLTGPAEDISTEQFIFNPTLLESRLDVFMEAGKSYDVRVIVKGPEELAVGEPTPFAATLCFEEYRSDEEAIAEAVKLSRDLDLSIIYAGRNGQYESEGFDLEDMQMPLNQTALIKAVAAVSKKTVLVLHCGNPIDVSPFVDDVDAILNAHFPGQEGARAVTDLLTGKVCPSGRLATTWFKSLQDCPSFEHFSPKGVEDGNIYLEYKEGLEVGYRCRDSQNRVRWPFGFGLSYTSFSYSGLKATVNEESTVPKLKCCVVVKNTGAVSGKEVIHLYIKPAKDTSVWRPARELKAFTKVSLQPGVSQLIKLEVDLDMACSYWDENDVAWRMQPGMYQACIADQQVDFAIQKGLVWNHL